MRKLFVAELEGIGEDLVAMSRAVETAIRNAGRALLDRDVALAEAVIAADAEIDAMERALDERCVLLLAQQAPVARDLRVVVSALRMSASLERMGDLARHIAEDARRAYPSHAVPESMLPTFTEMDQDAVRVAEQTTVLLETRDIELAAQIEADDDHLDQLHQDTFTAVLDPAWDGSARETLNVALCGRYYERFGDHAVSIARRIVFLVTGEFADDRGVAQA